MGGDGTQVTRLRNESRDVAAGRLKAVLSNSRQNSDVGGDRQARQASWLRSGRSTSRFDWPRRLADLRAPHAPLHARSTCTADARVCAFWGQGINAVIARPLHAYFGYISFLKMNF